MLSINSKLLPVVHCSSFDSTDLYIIKSSVKGYQPTLLFPIATNFEDHTCSAIVDLEKCEKKQCGTQKLTRS